MTTELSLIGVAVPTYNRPDYLKILLQSIPACVPVVVSENGLHLTPEFKAEFPAVQFCVTDQILEPLQNWNTAVRKQSTRWVAIPGDDDVYDFGAFEVVRRHIDQNPTAEMIVCGHRVIDQHGNQSSGWASDAGFFPRPGGFQIFKYGVDARMPSIFFKKSLFERLNGFDERFLITAGDSDFLQRATLIGDCYFAPDLISRYRVWKGGTTSQKIATLGWMQDIELWCNSVERFDKIQGTGLYSQKIRDEIWLRNLIAGLSAIKEKPTVLSRIRYLRACTIPRHGLLQSYLRLARVLIC